MNRRILIMGILLLHTGSLVGQGIDFQELPSWTDVLNRARIENKFIFVDVYATWCGPCKEMDKKVYPNEQVAELLNNQFISIKVQHDKTDNDDSYIKSWYEDAERLVNAYKVDALPTYLFFTAEGKLAHRAFGFQDVPYFLEAAKVAMTDPIGKYQRELEAYNQGKRNYDIVFDLIKYVRDIKKEKEMSLFMAKDYKAYLNELDENELLKKEYLDFIGEYYMLINSDDKFFKLCYNRPKLANKAKEWTRTDLSWADWQVKQTIEREEIDNLIWKDAQKSIPKTNDPVWNKMEVSIAKKYPKVDSRELIDNKRISFYKRVGNWEAFVHFRRQQIALNPPKAQGGLSGDAWRLNVDAWDLFQHCNDRKLLEIGLGWATLAIKLDDEWRRKSGEVPNLQIWDTKANLLYKLGRVDEAIALEQKAIEIDNKMAQERGMKDFVSAFSPVIEKMKRGEPTW